MINTGKLAGRTALITGASRGIGRSIALKLASDRVNVVIAAKTAEPHPKLPGTIYTVAEEIEKIGGKCLPCIVDVRDENAVQKAVEAAVRKFGVIDILINNASAISLTSTLDTPMKVYDLMHQVNIRGTFLVSQKCIPYLKQGKNPHILNISPPLLMESQWFAGYIAYTMSKFGMSMCVLGMHEELRPYRIAVNALWPRTAIWTAAMEFIGGSESASGCRKPEIMADAAYAILTKDSGNFTGNFCIDDQVLEQEGLANFNSYAIDPATPLMPDLFVPGGSVSEFAKISAERRQSRRKLAENSNIRRVFRSLERVISSESSANIDTVYEFDLSGDFTGHFFLDLKTGSAGETRPENRPSDVVVTCNSEDFVRMFDGELKPTMAFMTGRMKIKGDMDKAFKLEKFIVHSRKGRANKL